MARTAWEVHLRTQGRWNDPSYLFDHRDPQLFAYSDCICTALQLANFWQDVPADLDKGRLYLPLELLRKHGCDEEDVLQRRATPAFRAALREAVEVARGLFRQGLPLARIQDLVGGGGEENCRITLAVLGGEKGPRRDVVLLNAGAVLYAAGKAPDLRHSLGLAAWAVDSGAARKKLEELVAFTQGLGK